MDPELTFSGGLVGAMTVLFAVCVLLPAMYYVWTVYRRRFNHVAMLGGLACFFFFAYFLAQTLLRLLLPTGPTGAGMWGYGIIRALCVSVCEIGGVSLTLWFLHRQQHATVRVPIGFALGYRLFEMLWLGAVNTVIPLSLALTVNREGLPFVLEAVEETQRSAMELQLRTLAETAPGVYWMSTVDYVCRFALSAALARLIWYGFEGGRLPEDKRLIAAAFGLDFLCEGMLALHEAGGSYHLCAAIYYVLVAGAVCLAYFEARRRDDPEQLRADHLKSRVRLKKRY